MSGYRINEEDVQKALRQLQGDDPGNANREYAIQMLEGMHEFAKGVASSDAKTLKELEEALEEKGDDPEDETTPSDGEKWDSSDGSIQGSE